MNNNTPIKYQKYPTMATVSQSRQIQVGLVDTAWALTLECCSLLSVAKSFSNHGTIPGQVPLCIQVSLILILLWQSHPCCQK
jgi:hypothetical protein